MLYFRNNNDIMILEEEKSFASKCTTPEELEIILRSNLKDK
jgi:hypothetical protein